MDTSILLLGALLIAVAVITLRFHGWPGVTDGLAASGQLFKRVGIQMTLGFLLAGFIQVVIPSHVVATWMGENSGLRGLLVGMAGGMLAPGGPFVQFPLLAALHKSGATICMVTHDPRYAEYADRGINLFDGRIVEETVKAV